MAAGFIRLGGEGLTNRKKGGAFWRKTGAGATLQFLRSRREARGGGESRTSAWRKGGNLIKSGTDGSSQTRASKNQIAR